MKNKYRLLGIYLPIYAAVLLSCVIMRTVASLIHFDYHTNYFSEDSLISVSNILLVIGIVLLLSYAFTARKDLKLIPNFTSALTYVPTGIVGVALIFVAVLMLIFTIDGFQYARMLGSLSTFGLGGFIYAACAIFAILSAIHFALTATIETRTNASRATFGLCTVVFLALYTAYIYFDTNLPLNAPSKLIDEMAYLSAAVFFLYETRLSLGREKWRGYIAFGFIASLLTAYSSIPSLIVYFAKAELLSLSIYESLLTFALFLFITARIIITGELVEDKPSQTVLTIIEAAENREKDIFREEEVDVEEAYEANENQITIEDLEKENAEQSPTEESVEGEPQSDVSDNDSAEQTDNTTEQALESSYESENGQADAESSEEATPDTDENTWN